MHNEHLHKNGRGVRDLLRRGFSPAGPNLALSRIGKSSGFILLHKAARQPPWNDTLAEKHWGRGGSTEALTFRLILRNRAGLSGDPIGLLQFDAPEKGSWGNKFDAHTLALLGIVAEIDDSAFLLFLRSGIDEYDQRPYLQILLGVEQSAMGADHDRFAGMPKPPALLIL
jgi:hypothetical protein